MKNYDQINNLLLFIFLKPLKKVAYLKKFEIKIDSISQTLTQCVYCYTFYHIICYFLK